VEIVWNKLSGMHTTFIVIYIGLLKLRDRL